eukprot:COSAG01_NODE_38975_length_482_cov_8.096606_1_plen_44_part_10
MTSLRNMCLPFGAYYDVAGGIAAAVGLARPLQCQRNSILLLPPT